MVIRNSVLVYQSSKSGDVVQIVSKSKLSALVASISRADAVRLILIYTVREIMKTKVRL